MTLRPILLGLAVAGLGACIEPRIEKPLSPETDELTDNYANVGGELQSAMMAPMVAEVEESVSSMGSICGWPGINGLLCETPGECNAVFTCAGLAEARALAEEVKQLILDGANSDEDTVDTENGDRVLTNPFRKSEGYVRLRRICAGHGEVRTLDEANGILEMNAGFTNLSLDPVIWADFAGCQFRVLNAPFAQITLSGRMLLILSEDQVRPDTEVSFLTAFDLEIETELGTANLAASFRYEPTGTRLLILIRDVFGSGTNILFYSEPGSTGFITSGGKYACDFTARICTGPEGEEVAW